jgi:membrane protein required for colicin V production
MNWLDIIILIAFALAILIGLVIGLIRAVLSLAGLVVGVILAGRFYGSLSGVLSFISQPKIAGIVAFAIILVAVLVATGILIKVLETVISAVKLGWINRLGGALFELILAFLICGAFLAIWVKLFGINPAISQSKIAIVLLDRFPAVLALLPSEFDDIRSFFK